MKQKITLLTHILTLAFLGLSLTGCLSFKNMQSHVTSSSLPSSSNTEELLEEPEEAPLLPDSACEFQGKTVPSGQTVITYKSASVAYGSVCQSETRTCNNGNLSGSYAYPSCSVQGPASCSFNGTNVVSGNGITAYKESSAAYGTTCQSETRTCDNGNLSGSYAYPSCSVQGPATYYVSTSGSDSNNGLSEATAFRTLKHASAKLKAGETLYVKAGSYVNDTILLSTSGTQAQPITIEGYRTTPGDVQHVLSGFTNTTVLNGVAMPLLDGASRTNTATAIDLVGRSHVTVRNFQIKRYEVGVYAWGSTNVLIENILGRDFGNPQSSYSGFGIFLSGGTTDSAVKSSGIINAGAQGISIGGDRNLVSGCQVYADDNTTGMASATDYYIVVANGNDNTVENSVVTRVGNLTHGGHGIGAKYCSTNNKFFNNSAYNIRGEAFWAAHRGAYGNWFSGNYVEGGGGYGMVVRDGSSYNWFDNMTIYNAYAGISFADTTEDESPDPYSCTGETGTSVVKLGGVKNTFENIKIYQVDTVIDFSYYEISDARSYYNTFTGMTVQSATYLFRTDHSNFSNEIKNSSISGVQNYQTSTNGWALGISFQNTTFTNNGFSAP